MSDVEGMGWLKRVWLYGFGPLELVDEEDGVKYYATRSLKRSIRSVERSERKNAQRYLIGSDMSRNLRILCIGRWTRTGTGAT